MILTEDPLLFMYASAELILALHISLSNFVVIYVYLRSKHIRTPTNAYIFSLALTDFLAGALGIPFTVASVLTRWPGNYYACLAIHLILCVLCTVSTLHLLAMAVDKYLTICLKKFDHQRTSSSASIRKTRANFMIISAWISGAAIAGLPMVDGFGFSSRTIGNFQGECHFTLVVDYRYLVFVIFFGTIILPSAIIAYCYMAIYSHIRHEESQIKCLLRASERQRRINARRKLIRILLILVLTYAICWYPLYLINTADLFLPVQFHAGRTVTLAAVVLSHLNCALNPLIYAYGVPGFKHSLRRFLPVKAGSNCSNNGPNPYTGSVPLPKSPFIGNGMPMGKKKFQIIQPGDMCSNNHPNSIGNQRQQRMPPVGKFSRASSTMNATLPSPFSVTPAPLSSPPPPFSAQKSSLSLVESRREQFRCRDGPETCCHLQNSTTTETEERSADSVSVERCIKFKQNSLEPQHSLESTISGPISANEEEFNGNKMPMRKKSSHRAGEEEEEKRLTDIPHSKRESIASKLSTWSVRIFNGQWLVRSARKLDSREEAQQRLMVGIINGAHPGDKDEAVIGKGGTKQVEEDELCGMTQLNGVL